MSGHGARRSREQGSRDWRMLPVALSVWTASLTMHLTFPTLIDGDAMTGVPLACAPVMALGALGILAALTARYGASLRWRRVGRCASACRGALAVMLVAAMLASVAALSAELVQWRDPAAEQARRSGRSMVTMTLAVTVPATVSSLRGSDCQADAQSRALAAGPLIEPASAPIRVFASGEGCAALAAGATVSVTGMLQQARFGAKPLWLTATGDAAITTMREPDALRRAIAHLQRSFIEVTEPLSDQARVLVPGLTMGVLGQDYYATGCSGPSPDGGRPAPARRPVDEAYAAMVETQFRTSGIMHLMAVSGGHFALIAAMVRRLCAWLLLPRQVVAVLVAGSYLLLAACMHPSDSVLRALIMGLLSAGALAVGRRSQSMSALCWSVTGVLLAEPAMAYSLGFALSSAAVLGLILFARPLGAWLAGAMPRALADMLAMTVAAQAFTLPIQVLMTPQLPLASIPANLLVGPFVGFATLSGLAALALAWCAPWIAGPLAWLSGCGTAVMERVSAWMSAGRYALVPWAGGVGGALLMAAVETLAALALAMLKRRRTAGGAGLPGTPFRPRLTDRIGVWAGQTRMVLDDALADALVGALAGDAGAGTSRNGASSYRRSLRRRAGIVVQRYEEIGTHGKDFRGERAVPHRVRRRPVPQRADRARPAPSGARGAPRRRTHRT